MSSGKRRRIDDEEDGAPPSPKKSREEEIDDNINDLSQNPDFTVASDHVSYPFADVLPFMVACTCHTCVSNHDHEVYVYISCEELPYIIVYLSKNFEEIPNSKSRRSPYRRVIAMTALSPSPAC